MALVIVNKTVSVGQGEKVFKDALVADGTLFLVDFSNRGGTNNFSVTNGSLVNNLAKESSNGIKTQPYISTTKVDSELNAKKGFTADGIIGGGAYGLIIPKEVLNYMNQNPSHKFLFTMWLNTGTSGVARGFIRSWGGGTDWANTSFRGNIATNGNLTMTVAGAIVQDTGYFPNPNSEQMVAYLYEGVGQPIKVWINNTYKGVTAQNATGFTAVDKQIVVGKPEIPQTGNQTIYRMLIEDLTISGRTAEAVVEKDYNYVNQLGEYLDKPTKRPFATV